MVIKHICMLQEAIVYARLHSTVGARVCIFPMSRFIFVKHIIINHMPRYIVSGQFS